MSWLIVQHKSGHSPNNSTSDVTIQLGANWTAGNRIIVVTDVWNGTSGGVASVADDGPNAWTGRNSESTGSDNGELKAWDYQVATTPGANPTITVHNDHPGICSVVVFEVSGLDTSASPIDASGIGSNTDSSPTATTTGNVSAAGGLGLACYGDAGWQNATTHTGFTNIDGVPHISGQAGCIRVDYLTANPSNGAAFTAHTDVPSTAGWAELAIVYKLAAGGTTVIPGPISLSTVAYAPVVQKTIVTATPTVLSLAEYAPRLGLSVIPGVLSLVSTAYGIALNTQIVMGVTAVAASEYAPVLQTNVVAGVIALTTSLFAPSAGLGVVPGAASLVVTEYAPVLTTGIVAGTGALATTAFAVTLQTSIITAAPTALSLSEHAAGIGLGVVPGSLALTTTEYATILNTQIVADVTSVALTTYAPSILLGVIVTPAPAVAVLSEYAPVLSEAIVTAVPTAIVVSEFAPSIGLGVVPGTVGLTISGQSALLAHGYVPGTLALGTAKFAVGLRSTIVMGVTALATTEYPPVLGASITVVVPSGSLLLAEYAPALQQTIVSATATALAISGQGALLARGFVPGTLSLVSGSFGAVLRDTIVMGVTGLMVTPFAPSTGAGSTVTPSTVNASIVGHAPVIVTAVVPATLAINITPRTIVEQATIVLGSASLSLTEYPPNVIVGATTTVAPGTGTLVIAEVVPEITIGPAIVSVVIMGAGVYSVGIEMGAGVYTEVAAMGTGEYSTSELMSAGEYRRS